MGQEEEEEEKALFLLQETTTAFPVHSETQTQNDLRIVAGNKKGSPLFLRLSDKATPPSPL